MLLESRMDNIFVRITSHTFTITIYIIQWLSSSTAQRQVGCVGRANARWFARRRARAAIQISRGRPTTYPNVHGADGRCVWLEFSSRRCSGLHVPSQIWRGTSAAISAAQAGRDRVGNANEGDCAEQEPVGCSAFGYFCETMGWRSVYKVIFTHVGFTQYTLVYESVASWILNRCRCIWKVQCTSTY